MLGKVSRMGTWSRLLSVTAVAVLALLYFGPAAALAATGTAPAIRSMDAGQGS